MGHREETNLQINERELLISKEVKDLEDVTWSKNSENGFTLPHCPLNFPGINFTQTIGNGYSSNYFEHLNQ